MGPMDRMMGILVKRYFTVGEDPRVLPRVRRIFLNIKGAVSNLHLRLPDFYSLSHNISIPAIKLTKSKEHTLKPVLTGALFFSLLQ